MAISESSGTQVITTAYPARSRGRNLAGYLFILPALAILAITSVYPVVYSLALSVFDWKWGTDMDFVGLANYMRLLNSASFWQVMGQTFYFAAGAVAVEMTLGLALALVVNRLGFGVSLIRTLLLTPLMVSGIIVSLIWKILLDPTLGIVNYLFGLVGLPRLAWLGQQSTAMPSIILIDTWWQTAFVFIVLAAGLQSLPREPFEAAEVDGASGWQVLCYLTLPMLKPVLITVLIFRTIDTLKVFDIIFGTTGGGPAQSTEAVQTLAYRMAFDFLQLSRSMTLMIIFSIIILAISVLYLRAGGQAEENV